MLHFIEINSQDLYYEKNIVVAALIAGSFVSISAFAQGKNFEGFSVAFNANSASSNTERNTAGLVENFGDSPQNFILQAAYGVSMGSSGIFGMGGTYTLADFNAGPIKGKDRYSLYLEPGLMVDGSTLIYVKSVLRQYEGRSSAWQRKL